MPNGHEKPKMSLSQISKKVGWKEKRIFYPSERVIESALNNKNIEKFITWIRFLPFPRDEKEKTLLKKITEGFSFLKQNRKGEKI